MNLRMDVIWILLITQSWILWRSVQTHSMAQSLGWIQNWWNYNVYILNQDTSTNTNRMDALVCLKKGGKLVKVQFRYPHGSQGSVKTEKVKSSQWCTNLFSTFNLKIFIRIIQILIYLYRLHFPLYYWLEPYIYRHVEYP